MQVKQDRLTDVPFDKNPNVRGKITPRLIVMHYTAGGSALSSIRAIRNCGLSAHLFVDRKTSDGWTREGLGRTFSPHEVAVAGHKNGEDPMGWELFPDPQQRVLTEIALALRKAYPITQEVVGHYDISPGRKSDPGPAFPMGRFQNIGGGAIGSGSLDENDFGEFEVLGRDTLNLRGGSGIGFDVLRKLSPGTRLRVVRLDGDWRMVDLEGDGQADGFVHRAFLRRVGS